MIEQCITKLNKLHGQYLHYVQSVKDEKIALVEAENKVQKTEQAQKIVQEVAQAIQKRVHEQIAGVVSQCLKTVFQKEAYEFKIDFIQSRGKTEAVLLFVRQGKELDPLTSSGGGVCDVTSFALRLASLILSRPRKRRLLCLDEPFKHLSANYRPRVKSLLEQMAERFEMQFIMVTHADDLKLGRIVQL